MNNIQVIWLAVALVGVVVVVLLAVAVLRRQGARPAPAVRTAWLAATTTSGTMFISIGAKVAKRMPNATAVDVGALIITGILMGIFLVLGLKPSPSNRVN